MAVKAGDAPESGKDSGDRRSEKFSIRNPQTHFSRMFGVSAPYVQRARAPPRHLSYTCT